MRLCIIERHSDIRYCGVTPHAVTRRKDRMARGAHRCSRWEPTSTKHCCVTEPCVFSLFFAALWLSEWRLEHNTASQRFAVFPEVFGVGGCNDATDTYRSVNDAPAYYYMTHFSLHHCLSHTLPVSLQQRRAASTLRLKLRDGGRNSEINEEMEQQATRRVSN